MKSESNISPKIIDIINYSNGISEVIFCENIIKSQRGEDTLYTYDEYRITVKTRKNLANSVNENLKEWLEEAKSLEYNTLASKCRVKRNDLLKECDWTQMIDSPLTQFEKMEWSAYRQKLRDITIQKGFPYSIEFPVKPTSKEVI